MIKQRAVASWSLAPHTGAKLLLLRAYLSAWFPILSRSAPERVFYIDGFAGPGRYTGGEDGSPIVALKALGLRGNLAQTTFEFHFVERRQRQAEALRQHVEALRAQRQIAHNAEIHFYDNSTFADSFANVIAPRLDQFPDAPAFALVDPFGWTGLPMGMMRRLLHRPHTEVLINFMFEEINRFLSHPDQPKNFDELFGAIDWREGYRLTGDARRNHLHNLYQRQLSGAAQYVRSFEMVNERGASDYFLFFATNNLLGLRKMKEAMWHVDPGGGRKFSDMTNPAQLVLLQPEPDRQALRRQIVRRFSAKRTRVSDVEQFVLEHTAFHAGHYKKVLAGLEKAGQLTVVSPTHGRRLGTFAKQEMVLEFGSAADVN